VPQLAAREVAPTVRLIRESMSYPVVPRQGVATSQAGLHHGASAIRRLDDLMSVRR
jgi:hypothetical protein